MWSAKTSAPRPRARLIWLVLPVLLAGAAALPSACGPKRIGSRHDAGGGSTTAFVQEESGPSTVSAVLDKSLFGGDVLPVLLEIDLTTVAGATVSGEEVLGFAGDAPLLTGADGLSRQLETETSALSSIVNAHREELLKEPSVQIHVVSDVALWVLSSAAVVRYAGEAEKPLGEMSRVSVGLSTILADLPQEDVTVLGVASDFFALQAGDRLVVVGPKADTFQATVAPLPWRRFDDGRTAPVRARSAGRIADGRGIWVFTKDRILLLEEKPDQEGRARWRELPYQTDPATDVSRLALRLGIETGDQPVLAGVGAALTEASLLTVSGQVTQALPDPTTPTPGDGDGDGEEALDFDLDVKPIAEVMCGEGCHQHDEWDQATYWLTRKAAVIERLSDETMPPPGRTMSAADRAAFLQWVQAE